ncbi:tetratricopeptide repeat protein [Streptomyces seoulensis]|uniref:Tetratricopeptide repeat protein n=1 Tax=Streptomyces seoulensis TaxID=73044 RepID=A0A4P6TQS0_STRSO|nr:tetratricopeptide repeat protein [Streptomyces seoulensis]QBJ88873.1 tetratricopeptide repeat protein [Streptomyces seoulensis]
MAHTHPATPAPAAPGQSAPAPAAPAQGTSMVAAPVQAAQAPAVPAPALAAPVQAGSVMAAPAQPAPAPAASAPLRPCYAPGDGQVWHLLRLVPGPDIAVAAAASLLAVGAERAAVLLERLAGGGLCERTGPGRYRPRPAPPAHPAGVRPGDGEALRRLAGHYLHTAHHAERLLAPHRPQLPLAPVEPGCTPERFVSREAALAWLDEEHHALTAIRESARDRGERWTVFHLAACLNGHYVRRGHTALQQRQWADALRAAHALGDPEAQITAHRYAGQAASRAGRHPDALAHLQRAVRIAERHGRPGPQAWAYYILAWTEEMAGDDAAALTHAICAAGLFARAQQWRAQADALNAAGWYFTRLGDPVQAGRYCARALDLARRHRYLGGQAAALDSLGLLAQANGRHEDAVHAFTAALAHCRTLGNTYQEAGALDRLGDSYAATGRPADARTVWGSAAAVYRAQDRLDEAASVERRLTALA